MQDQVSKTTLDTRPQPAWYSEAKLGIFIHWGLYSIPAFAENTHGTYAEFMHGMSSMHDTKGKNPYAEWYLNGLRIPDSPTALHHAKTYGQDFSYYDFRKQFEANASKANFDTWADFFVDAGAKYVVMVTRHLDGYPLWPTKVTNEHAPDLKSPRDIIGDVTKAVRSRGLKMGMYYAGGIDWTFTKKPIRTMTDLMDQEALGPAYAAYATGQYQELIERYQPSILWNDMGWPAEKHPHEIFKAYYESVPDGLVNDRWTQLRLPHNRLVRQLYLGVMGGLLRMLSKANKKIPEQPAKNHYDIKTYEYELPTTTHDRTWELTRGLGNSFGYNANETAADLLNGTELIHMLVEVVAKGGNLLINIGPDGQGAIPEIQAKPLLELGQWLRTNGEAIYGTHPRDSYIATQTADNKQVYFTQKNDVTYAIILSDSLYKTVTINNISVPSATKITVLGKASPLTWSSLHGTLEINVPAALPAQPAYVFAITPSLK